ncbi:MAG: Unknown protein [uncultured Sulfurovum sp.]|uniref:Lipoprotein n=1 Tax=uncultured Sulfurovum sp. TaxID=269237 RepID=A0A6S6TX29_9BACT|nr:MAG: Unknown protein [uncultured Sulfurovum sp.]
MKFLPKKILPILSITTLFMFNACSSHTILSSGDKHLYGHNYGLVHSPEADAAIQKELITMSLPTQIDIPIITDPELTTELIMEEDAFFAEDYIPTAPIITYKYKFDPKFYDNAEWRRMDLE